MRRALTLTLVLVSISGCAEAERLARDAVRTVSSDSCSGSELFCDDFDAENGSAAGLNYDALSNWTVTRGAVDLIGAGTYDFLPGNGLYLDLDGSTRQASRIELRRPLQLEPGTYRLSFRLAGSQGRDDENRVAVRFGSLYDEVFVLPPDQGFQTETRTVTVPASQRAALSFDHEGGDNYGALLDVVRVERVQ